MTLRCVHPRTLEPVALTDEMRDQIVAIWDESFPKIGFVQSDPTSLVAATEGRALTLEVFLQFGPDQDYLRFIFRNQGNAQFCDLVLGSPDWDRLRSWVMDLRERVRNTAEDMKSWF